MTAITRSAGLLFLTLCVVAIAGLECPIFAVGAQTSNVAAPNQGKILHIQDDIEWVRYGRWSALRQHTIHTYAHFSNDDYCAVFATTVIDEAKDLESNEGKQLPMAVEGKELLITLPDGRHLKMHLVKPGECERRS